jgi:hypothetical protein
MPTQNSQNSQSQAMEVNVSDLDRARQIRLALEVIHWGDRQEIENLVLPLLRLSWAVPFNSFDGCINGILGLGE